MIFQTSMVMFHVSLQGCSQSLEPPATPKEMKTVRCSMRCFPDVCCVEHHTSHTNIKGSPWHQQLSLVSRDLVGWHELLKRRWRSGWPQAVLHRVQYDPDEKFRYSMQKYSFCTVSPAHLNHIQQQNLGCHNTPMWICYRNTRKKSDSLLTFAVLCLERSCWRDSLGRTLANHLLRRYPLNISWGFQTCHQGNWRILDV